MVVTAVTVHALAIGMLMGMMVWFLQRWNIVAQVNADKDLHSAGI